MKAYVELTVLFPKPDNREIEAMKLPNSFFSDLNLVFSLLDWLLLKAIMVFLCPAI